ncbi:phospholipase A [Gilvimarinus sp. SDUM040013]|uniref:Phospholipase A1 n=1 Tax=Gilvimarinus gilvus TaxID=3058038 RepID=A0ABU4RWH4_9GAMM|nr:phospholipase A [Gilvimarinus sp. SDUM040013]MDO3387063.1 phospholipase A [Gilvimarinus sp. SDUM040013]MDX6848043.1 phospholipase A [Gilvimarinus sp. SDUM040013]
MSRHHCTLKRFACLTLIAILPTTGLAQPADSKAKDPEVEQLDCLTQMVQTADDDMTLAKLREGCQQILEPKRETNTATQPSPPASREANSPASDDEATPVADPLDKRMTIEAINSANRFLLTPHNRNYVLPAVYTQNPNQAPFEQALAKEADLQHTEIEFQLSIKVLVAQDLLHDNGNLYVAYTNHSFWQAYNSDISRPFRETNHEPELIFSATTEWEIFGFRNVLNQVILSHQSNGQSGDLSRSWNRVKARSIFERGHFAFAITPWYRLPEDAEKDDNPDIKDYYGQYELTGAYTRNDHIISFMTRRPFANKGALELNWSFPVTSTVRGYMKVFDGYGASLIDYNAHTRSIGLGVTFTDIF